jgi:hypothetical protein
VAATEPDLLTWVALHVAEVRFDDTLAGLFASAIDTAPRGRPDWWIVTDLVNPTAAYYRRRYPQIEAPLEVQLRLDYGKRMHETAFQWFRQLPGFVSVEGRVDGAAVDFPRLRGKIDFRIVREIIEFKTTQFIHSSPADVLVRTPQDLEQLLIYALLSDSATHPHSLVYFNEADGATPFRVFKVQILHPRPVKQFFRARFSALDHAHLSDDPSRLGQCRYMSTGCAYLSAGRCSCESRPVIDLGELVPHVRVTRDQEFEDRLSRIRITTGGRRASGLRVWDLFTPRRAIIRVQGTERFRPDENYTRRRQQEAMLLTSDLSGGSFDVTLEGIEDGTPLVGRGLTVRLRESTGEGSRETIIPALIRVSNGRPPDDARRLADVYKAQLGAYCALKGSAKGLAVVTYALHSDAVQCYSVRFDNIGEIRVKLTERLASLQACLRRGDSNQLPPCPDWLQRRCEESCLCRGETGTENLGG